jgi:TM2 domain-containing membrane protein YozV
MQTIDIFRFSRHLRGSGQFTDDQADAIAAALAEAMIAPEPEPEPEPEEDLPDWVPPAPVSTHNKTVAALFAIFLGSFGLHQFYLGRPGTGLLYLVFCWTLVPAIVGFIEGVRLLSMGERDFALEYR